MNMYMALIFIYIYIYFFFLFTYIYIYTYVWIHIFSACQQWRCTLKWLTTLFNFLPNFVPWSYIGGNSNFALNGEKKRVKIGQGMKLHEKPQRYWLSEQFKEWWVNSGNNTCLSDSGFAMVCNGNQLYRNQLIWHPPRSFHVWFSYQHDLRG